jgi:hypothetical protein
MKVWYQGQLMKITVRLPNGSSPEDVEGANGQHGKSVEDMRLLRMAT